MNNKFIFSLFCLTLVVTTAAIESPIVMLRNERFFGLHAKTMADSAGQLFYSEQTLDHFNHQDHRTWSQRYFVNDTFWDKENAGPVFVQIGGEGPISPRDVTGLAMSTYAEQYNALQFSVEHRFYGLSNPLPATTENLQYLSSEQALADLSQFIDFVRTKYGVPESSRLVVFGCSYPGSLSAWFKIKYPQMVAGAVSNSAPVHAVLDFFQYLEVVDKDLGLSCDKRIQEASTTLDQMLQSASGQQQVQQMFRTCTVPSSKKDIETFVSNVVGNWQGASQYDYEHHNPVTTDSLCAMMENQTMTPIEAYAAVSNSFLPAGQCMDISYDTMIDELRNTTVGNAMRSWMYQSCTEFGYFQTTDAPAEVQPFGTMLPLRYYTDMCLDIFGGKEFVDPTPATNLHFGSIHPVGATNILWVSGTLDPWHRLTVTESLTPSLQAILIEGTAHCAQLFPPSDLNNPPPGLAIAQQKTSAQIGKWLKESPY